MSRRGGVMDQVNETPVTFAILLAYVTMAYLTESLGFGFHKAKLIEWGGAVGWLIQDGELWRLLTHAVNHGNLIHLGLNAYALVTLGPLLERYLGAWRFAVLYVASALSGCLLALLWNDPWVPLVGGSGALFGMLGAALALQVRGGRTTLDFIQNAGSRHLIGIVAINLLVGFLIPFVSNTAHIGGLIGGFVTIYCYFDTGRRSRIDATGRVIQAGFVVLLLSLVTYQMRPVMRIDCQLRLFLTETEPARRKELGALTDVYFRYSRAQMQDLLAKESEPKTGNRSVAIFEDHFAYEDPALAAALARWKQR